MAKKTKKKNKKVQVNEMPENALPQNILPVGERVEENKNIYISQPVYKQIHKFTKNKTTDESGGVLVGTVIEEFGKTNIVISGFVEAKHCEATATTLKFTHETWEYVHKEVEKKHKDKKILGWIHTHPDFGIFLSEYDKFIHENFFSDESQVAYVVDPIQHIEGFYFWINGNIEKCKGFYIYDETGTPITVDVAKDEPETETTKSSGFGMSGILIGLLSIAVVLLIFSNISTNKKLEELEDRQEQLSTQQALLSSSANQTLSEMYQTVTSQSADIQTLTDALIEVGILEAPEVPEEDASGTTENPDDTLPEATGDEAIEPTQGGSVEDE